MRILFVTSLRYPPQGLGGARVSIHQLCELLHQRGHQVAVLGQLYNEGWLWVRNRLLNKVRGLQCPEDHILGYPVYRGWNPLDGIPEVVRRFQPDIAIAGTSATIAIANALVDEEVPTVAYFRSLEFEKFGDKPKLNPLLTSLANSTYVAKRVKEELGLKSTVIRSIVNPQYYLTDRKPIRALHVNPDECKGIHITLDLARRRPDVYFDVVRCWPMTDRTLQFKRQAEQLDNVAWHEPADDMRHFYRRTRLLLAPSLWEEASARVVQEAQLNGIPVLASNRGGLPESVGAGGHIVDPDAPASEWESAFSRIWDDQERYEQYCNAAAQHASRMDQDPDYLLDALETTLWNHVLRTRDAPLTRPSASEVQGISP